MNATILDYGVGNVHSLSKALVAGDFAVQIVADPRLAIETDLLVLPGVGSFAFAAAHIAPARDLMREAIARGLPTIGICLGMQLMFNASDEGEGEGLGIFDGRVTRLDAARTPHIGWNSIDDVRDDSLRASGLRSAYYANSFACRPHDTSNVVAWTTHEKDRFPAAVRRGRITGMQFHPEKSSASGVDALLALARAVTS
jgi:glutamine amidotransferase